MVSNEELVELCKGGDKQALNDIIEANIGMVRYLMKRYIINSNNEDDVLQIGCLGIFEAAKKYDKNNIYKAKFSTFMAYFITGFISRYFRNNEIRNDLSLDMSYGDDDGYTLMSTLKSDEDIEYSCVENLYQRELKEDIRISMLKANSLIEREVIEYNYGLNCDMPLNMAHIAEILDVPPERVRQVKARALRKLRNDSLPIRKYRTESILKYEALKYDNVTLLLNSMGNYHFSQPI